MVLNILLIKDKIIMKLVVRPSTRRKRTKRKRKQTRRKMKKYTNKRK